MTALKFIDRMERLHLLIKRKGTGSPQQLATRLQLSESSVYEYIKTLKAMGGPIIYDFYRQSYVYEKPCSLALRYHVEPLVEEESRRAQAGWLSAYHYATVTGVLL